MAVVRPFKAWRYNPEKSSEMSKVVVPPYDVITEAELQEMKKLSPYNFSQIILSEGDQKHKKAAELLQQWKQKEVLIQDQNPCFYFYKQKFKLTQDDLFCQSVNAALVRYGFFATVQVEEYKKNIILPHEKTFAKYKQDRYELMSAAQGNMEPVFLGYDSNDFTEASFDEAVSSIDPIYEYLDRYGVTHQLWKVNVAKTVKSIEEKLDQLKLYILDGHHRYETALKFYQDNQKEKYKYVLANVCAFKQKGTVILPTHRLLKFDENLTIDDFQNLCVEFFKLEKITGLKELEKKLMSNKKIAFGIKYAKDNSLFYAELKGDAGNKLDLDFLHENFLKENMKPFYVRNIPEFNELLKNKNFDVGILVRPNTYEDVISKAAKGAVMPHKSTFFYPKIPSGLVIHCFE